MGCQAVDWTASARGMPASFGCNAAGVQLPYSPALQNTGIAWVAGDPESNAKVAQAAE
jgi:hypothetical protein